MHEIGGAHDLAPEGFTDCLVSETYAENRSSSCEVANEFDADARFVRRAGAGRDDDAFWSHGVHLIDRDLIIAANFDFCAQFAEILDQVISEGIVVIENENQVCGLLIPAYTSEQRARARQHSGNDQ